MWILRDRILAAANAGKSLIVLDGFPRSLQQLKAFMTEVYIWHVSDHRLNMADITRFRHPLP